MENKSEKRVVKNVVMNDNRKAIVDALSNSAEPLSLADISKVAGRDIKSGSMNSMVAANMVRVAGSKKVAKVVYVEVNVYELVK